MVKSGVGEQSEHRVHCLLDSTSQTLGTPAGPAGQLSGLFCLCLIFPLARAESLSEAEQRVSMVSLPGCVCVCVRELTSGQGKTQDVWVHEAESGSWSTRENNTTRF